MRLFSMRYFQKFFMDRENQHGTDFDSGFSGLCRNQRKEIGGQHEQRNCDRV